MVEAESRKRVSVRRTQWSMSQTRSSHRPTVAASQRHRKPARSVRGWRPDPAARILGPTRTPGEGCRPGSVPAASSPMSSRSLPVVAARREPSSLALRAAAAPALDLGSRIALAADLQATAGNAATTAALGEIRTDKPQAPPGGVKAIMDQGSGGQRGLTRSSFDANKMPLFKVQRPALEGSTYTTRAIVPRLPEPDHEVWWPSKGRHLIGSYGKGKRYLEVSADWSDKLLSGETRHVEDMDLAYEMTWGRVRDVLAEMAKAEKPYSGATAEAARDAAVEGLPEAPPGGVPARGHRADQGGPGAGLGAGRQGLGVHEAMAGVGAGPR